MVVVSAWMTIGLGCCFSMDDDWNRLLGCCFSMDDDWNRLLFQHG